MKIAEYNQMMAYLTRPEPEVLPEPKPQELLDLQEQNKKQRLLQALQKIGGGLEDSSLDFIRRQNFSNQGLAKPKRGLVDEPGSYAGKPGYVKPLSPENAKLFKITNPGEVWGEGRFGPEKENYSTRGNWINDADRKRKILKQTKGLITEEEYAKILSDELGQEIKPKKVEGKFGNKQKTQFGEISAKDFKGTYGSIKGGKTQGGSFKYYKPPTKSQIKAYKGALRQSDFNRLKPATVQAVLDLHKNYEQIYRKGNLPIIEDVVSKLGLKPGQAGRATVRLAQVYNGHQFKNSELQNIRKNTSAANKIFAKMEAAPFGDVYRQGVYEAALETIDAKLGNEVGTFASFKSKARKLLNDRGITQKGFNFNEIAGVTGSSRSGAEFSQFVDIMEKNLNQKTLANLQGQLSTARQKIVKDPTKFAEEAKKFNLKASALEEKYNIELPKLIKPEDVKSSYGVKRLKELKEQGLDLVKAANRDSYGIKVPKGALTAKEFNDPNNKKVRELIALVGCPDFKGNQAFAEGGRIGFSEGADCFNKGQKAINEVKIKPGAQSRNFAKFANRAYKLGRGIMKFGVIPEALFVGAESLIRMNLGDTLDEALRRATDLFIPGNQTDYADALKTERTVGPEAAEVLRNVNKWKRKNEELQSLKDSRAADLTFAGTEFNEMTSGMSVEDTNKTYDELENKKRKEVLDASVSADDQVLSQSYFNEGYDISKAKSTSAKIKGKVLEDESGLNVDLLAPEKNQQFQRRKNFRKDIQYGTDDFFNEIASEVKQGRFKNKEEIDKRMKELLEEKVKFKQQPLSDYVLKDGYTPEEVYGAQEGRGFLNKINREKFIRPGTYEATPEEIDANFDMQDGIMAAEGGRIGFAGGSRFGKVLSGLDYLIDLLKKKTITVKRGESGTRGTSNADSISDYRGKYYTPEGGGFETPAADARYYSKLGGDEGSPKVLTAELTPEEIKEGLRLRGLDLEDPEIGDIILPKSAEDKVKIDYLNTIRAKLEKYLKMAEGGRINFGAGSGPMSLKIIYIIMDRLRNLKNSTFSNYNQVRMYGEQKGITELLEPFKNIPNKNRITSAIDDAEELKKVMPDEYKSILDEIIDDTKQFKFKTAHDKQQALEKALPKELKFENLPEKMFPMPNPENPNFIVPYGYPDKNPFQKSRNLTRTEADKFTGKGTRKTYDTFNEKTKQYQEPSENTLISEEPIDEELESIIRDLDKGDLQ